VREPSAVTDPFRDGRCFDDGVQTAAVLGENEQR
jgi:hypothetical protein